MKFRIQHSKQFSKSDVVDIANALGIKVTDSMTVDAIRRALEAGIQQSPEAASR
jgi:hypothetical protein